MSIKIKFSDLNVANMLNYIKEAEIKEVQIFDISEEKIVCRAHPVDKSFVKHTATQTRDILKFDTLPSNFTWLLVPIYRLKKLKDILTIYEKCGDNLITGIITCEEDDGRLIAMDISFKSKKSSVKFEATEMYLASHISEEAWTRYSNRSNEQVKFMLKGSLVERLRSLCAIEGDDNSENKDKNTVFVMKTNKENGTIKFTSVKKGKWEIDYNPVTDGELFINSPKDIQLVMPSTIFGYMKSSEYEVYIVLNPDINQYIMIIYENEDNVMLKALLPFDPNTV
jgi:hypothetical protein